MSSAHVGSGSVKGDSLHPTPHTLHPTPYTLHPTPYTLHPTPYTLHHGLHALVLVLSAAARFTQEEAVAMERLVAR